MNLKRVAVRLAVALTVVVALCMFFGQTVLTLTTPKVTLIDAQNGRLEDRIPVTAELYFEKAESFTPEGAKDVAVMIDKVYVSAGDEVKKGDTLFTCKLLSEYNEAYKKQQEALQKEQEELLKLEMNKASTKNKSKNDAEAAYYEAQDRYTEAMMKLVDFAVANGIELSDHPDEWEAQFMIMTEDIKVLLDEMAARKDKAAKAKSRFLSINKKGNVKDDTYQYIKKSREAKQKIRAEQEKLVALAEKAATLKTVRAPRDGVVVKVDVKEGESYKAEKPAYQLSASAPVLRADITQVRKEVARDMRVEYKSDYETIRTSVTGVTRDAGKKYAAVELNEELLAALGGVRELTQQPVELSIVYRSKGNATLLPAAAVREDGDNHYVLVAEQRYTMWGEQLVARKMDVRVLESSDRVRAVDAELRYQKVIMGESTPIKEGDRVMEYMQ